MDYCGEWANIIFCQQFGKLLMENSAYASDLIWSTKDILVQSFWVALEIQGWLQIAGGQIMKLVACSIPKQNTVRQLQEIVHSDCCPVVDIIAEK